MYGNSKQVIIIKNIKSSFIEEAIFVLKHQEDRSLKGRKKEKVVLGNSDHIIQEAHNIINNYMKEHQSYLKSVDDYNKNNKKLFNKRKLITTNIIINISLFVSIGLFIFLITRLF